MEQANYGDGVDSQAYFQHCVEWLKISAKNKPQRRKSVSIMDHPALSSIADSQNLYSNQFQIPITNYSLVRALKTPFENFPKNSENTAFQTSTSLLILKN